MCWSVRKTFEGTQHRRRRLKKLWKRLHDLQRQSLSRDALLIKLGAAKKDAGHAW